MTLNFIWYWDRASEIFPNWRDGLRGAMDEIEKRGHNVKYYLDKGIPQDNKPLLLWDDSNSQFFQHIDKYTGRKGMILTTDPHNIDNLKKMDVVFCESEPVYNAVRRQGIHAVRAFGTDNEFYFPDKTVKKDIEYFYPATFSPWKRQSTIAHLGKDLLCVGTIQPDGVGEYRTCVENEVKIQQGYYPPELIREYYQRAKNVIIPAIHGSERTVMEAMACDILPEVNPDNKRTHSYIDEYKKSKCKTPSEFIDKFYSHKIYADKILKAYE